MILTLKPFFLEFYIEIKCKPYISVYPFFIFHLELKSDFL